MKTITFANSKGGVGKTTLTVGVARTLALLGKKILLVDIDPQGNLTSVFSNLDGNNELASVASWFNSKSCEEVLKKSIQKSNFSNIDVIPSYSKLVTQTLKSLANDTASDFVLKNNLKKMEKFLQKEYDYIFFDINPTTSLITLNVFLAVNEIIVTVTPHKFSFSGIYRFFNDYEEYISKWKQIGIPLANNMNSIILNNVRKNKTHNFIVDQLQKSTYKNLMLETTICGSLTIEKHTMISNPNLTDKSPFYLVTKELLKKGVL